MALIELKDGRLRAKVYVGQSFDREGKVHLHYKTKTFASRREAERWERKTKTEADEGSIVAGKRMRLSEYLDWWLEERAKPGTASHTYSDYKSHVERYIKPGLGRMWLDRINEVAVQQFMNALREETELSATTTRKTFAVLRKALNDAVVLKVLPRNPVLNVKAPRAAHVEKTALTDEQTKTLLDLVAGHGQLHGPVVLAALCGLRAGEVLGLKWSDIDFARQRLRVERAVEDVNGEGARLKDMPKSRHSLRTLPLSKRAARELRAWRKTVDLLRASAKEGTWEEHDLVCPSATGRPKRVSSLSKEWTDWSREQAKKGKLPRVTFHNLRDTYITSLLNHGLSVQAVRGLAGHESITTTMGYYHGDPNAESLARKVQDALFAGKRQRAKKAR